MSCYLFYPSTKNSYLSVIQDPGVIYTVSDVCGKVDQSIINKDKEITLGWFKGTIK